MWSCIVAALCCPHAVQAQLTRLHWSAPAGCPTRTYVERRINQLSSLAERPRADVRVRALVRRAPRQRYTLELLVDAQDYRVERSLEAASCRSIADAAAWFIATALDPNLPPADTNEAPPTPAAQATVDTDRAPQEEVASPEPARAPAPPPVGTGAPASGDTPSTRAAPTPPWRRWWRTGVHAGVWSAGLPAPQASLGARAGFGLELLYTELRVAWMFARTRTLSDDTQASFSSQQLGLASCAQWGLRVRAGPCATLDALRSEGSADTGETGKRSLFWASAGISVQLGWKLQKWLELMAESGIQLPISPRPNFSIEGLGAASVASPLGFHARLGVGIRSADSARKR